MNKNKLELHNKIRKALLEYEDIEDDIYHPFNHACREGCMDEVQANAWEFISKTYMEELTQWLRDQRLIDFLIIYDEGIDWVNYQVIVYRVVAKDPEGDDIYKDILWDPFLELPTKGTLDCYIKILVDFQHEIENVRFPTMYIE